MNRERSHVEVKKIDITENPEYETADWDEYDQGEVNRQSPPVYYTVKGHVYLPPKKGEFLTIERYERNGVTVSGLMRTSRIQSVDKFSGIFIVKTQNSVYTVNNLDRDNEKSNQDSEEGSNTDQEPTVPSGAD